MSAAHGQFGKPASQEKQEKEKPKVAVYVTSGDEEGKLNGFVGDYIVDAIVRSGKYTAIERTDDFLSGKSTRAPTFRCRG
ncbi:hypothetical protein FACS1894199_17540 [Bacteroidia bacterium]|nr:hypothetical protein FACS1894199_17540 [Bacteroidia bacterium]